MQKIPTLFKRNPDDMRHVLPKITEGCEWVIAGEGVPTRKYDGTCVMHQPPERPHTPDEAWYARREVKAGKEPPPNWFLIESDPATGKAVGWEPITQSPFVKFWQEAIDTALIGPDMWEKGTYELVGPKINGNPEGPQSHCLIRHADAEPLHIRLGNMGSSENTTIAPTGVFGTRLAYDSLRDQLTDDDFTYEGIVWHHPDGRMTKLKARDFR